MPLHAIAAGDSLACRVVVPPELGGLRQLVFDAAIERAGRVDQRRRVIGLIGEIDPVARSVLVHWPVGELTAGRWRVQVRASSVQGVSTFVLDEDLAVEPSLLPVRTQLIVARLALPSLRLRASGSGAPPGISELRLGSLRLSAEGQGALRIATVRLRLARMRVTALGSARTVAEAVLALPPLRAIAVGTGLRPQAIATLRVHGLRVEARGFGHIGTGMAALRLPRTRLTAAGEGGPASMLLGWEDNAPLLGLADDAPLEFEDGT